MTTDVTVDVAIEMFFKMFFETLGWDGIALSLFLIIILIRRRMKSNTRMNTILLNSGFMHGYCKKCGAEMWYKEYTDLCSNCKPEEVE